MVMGGLVGNVKHLEEKAKILNVIRAVVVVDSEPEHGMRFRVFITDNSGGSS